MLKLKAKYDVVILGSGIAASTCAIRCAELGKKVLCVDNQGIPETKKLAPGIFNSPSCLEITALSESAALYEELVHGINLHGIYAESVTVDLALMLRRKNDMVAHINQNTAKQFIDLGVEFINASAKLTAPGMVEVAVSAGQVQPFKVLAGHIVLATGSMPIAIACAPIDNHYIYDSAYALSLTEIPKRLAVLGAGVIGLELGGIWNRLGAETILLDAQESFLTPVDNQISREAYKIFSDQGLELRLGTRVISTKISNQKVLVEYQDIEGVHVIRVDKLIVASGRKPNSKNLSTPEVNLLLDENHFVHVNENCRTNLPNVFAIGDLTMLGPMIPEKGIAEALFVAEQIADTRSSPISYGTIPNVIHTKPEIAWVGHTEQGLRSKGENVNIGVSRLSVRGQTKPPISGGLVKVIACAESDAIKGIHIIHNHASELIAEAALALEFSATTEDIVRTTHSYPNFDESIRDACQAIISKKHNPLSHS